MRHVATWRTWDEPDRQVAVVEWEERSLRVVFPLQWAAKRGQRIMIARAKERIRELEGKTGRWLAPGSVLLAFSRHGPLAPLERIDPDVTRGIVGRG